jgi:uncharacterized protein with HEPN domain
MLKKEERILIRTSLMEYRNLLFKRYDELTKEEHVTKAEEKLLEIKKDIRKLLEDIKKTNRLLQSWKAA